MDARSFLDRQEELRQKLLRAVPRSARAKQLQDSLRQLVREQLRRESARPGPTRLPDPPRDFEERVGDIARPRQGELYGGQTPYWVEQ